MYKPLTLTHTSIRCNTINVRTSDVDLVQHAIDAYGFVLRTDPVLVQRDFTFSEFAHLIERTYDAKEPRVAAIVAALRATHELNLEPPKYKVGSLIRSRCDEQAEPMSICHTTTDQVFYRGPSAEGSVRHEAFDREFEVVAFEPEKTKSAQMSF